MLPQRGALVATLALVDRNCAAAATASCRTPWACCRTRPSIVACGRGNTAAARSGVSYQPQPFDSSR